MTSQQIWTLSGAQTLLPYVILIIYFHIILQICITTLNRTSWLQVAYTNWGEGEPTDFISECGVIGPSGYWLAAPCDEKRPFVCKGEYEAVKNSKNLFA